MKLDFLKNIFKSGAFQPILTVILVGLMVVLVIQVLGNNSNKKDDSSVQQISREVTFTEAADNYFNGSYNVLTTGSLYVKDLNVTATPSLVSTPSITQIPLIENKFDGIFFIIDKGTLKRFDTATQGVNSSMFFNRKGEIVYLDNSNKLYTLYKVPADTEKDAVTLFSSTDYAFKQRLFPLTPLMNDYKSKKFLPIERAYNVYSGKWSNPVFTDGKTVDITLETDPLTGVFSAMSIASTNPPSIIYFDFRKADNINNYDEIPGDYKSVPPPSDYKTKE